MSQRKLYIYFEASTLEAIFQSQRPSGGLKIVLAENAELGIAFDGDFDRCFFFDEFGVFVPGEYIVGLLAESFLLKEPGSKIIHDARVQEASLKAVLGTLDLEYQPKEK